jgi:predicted nucleic acid-binding protein
MTTPNKNAENLLSPEQVVEKGQKFYAEKLKAELEPDKNGKFVVIEIESGDYFIADTLVEALEKAKDKYPSKLFHTVKIGFEGIYKMGTYSRTGFSYTNTPTR